MDYRYDHLSQLLTTVLVDKPENIASHFEELSKFLKYDRLITSTDLLRNPKEKSATERLAAAQLKLLQVPGAEVIKLFSC